jgi:hypothetical protein
MDTATKAVGPQERLVELERHSATLESERAKAQAKLERERAELSTAEESRARYVLLLAGDNDDATRGYLENEVETVRRVIDARKLQIEGLEMTLAELARQTDATSAEASEIRAAIEAQERLAKFEAGKARIAARLAGIAQRVDELRLLLGDDVMDAFQFAEEFGVDGNRFLTFERERFFHEAAVRDRFHDVWGWQGSEMQFLLKPMQRNSPPR